MASTSAYSLINPYFQKILNSIQSCETPYQLTSCYNLIKAFGRLQVHEIDQEGIYDSKLLRNVKAYYLEELLEQYSLALSRMCLI